MESIKICAILALSALVSLILKTQNSRMSNLVGITGIIIAGIYSVNAITPVVDYLLNISAKQSEIILPVIRVVGVAYITEFALSVCIDTGEAALAKGVELVGKIEIVIIGFPIIKRMFEFSTELLQ